MIDEELVLLEGSSFFVDNIEIKPLTLRDIVKVGYLKYSLCLRMFNLDIEDMLGDMSSDIDNLTIFDILINLDIDDLKDNFIEAIRLFVDRNAKLVEQNILINGNIINRDNFDRVCAVIKKQNCIEVESDSGDNPADEKAREILKKREDVRKIISKAKKGEGEELSLADLISILASNGNGLNIMNIWNLTFYQFNNQFNRMKMLEDYDVGIRSILAGAQAEDVELKHWMSKINK